jgi:hypothetical protein
VNKLSLFIHFNVNGYCGWFPDLTILNNAVVNHLVHVSQCNKVHIHVFLGIDLRVELTGFLICSTSVFLENTELFSEVDL